MALVADTGWASIEELAREDCGILDLSDREGIDLEAKVSLAMEQTREQIDAFLRRNSTHRVGNAVATWSVRRWVTFAALSACYRDAYSTQVNDRYGAKWRAYDDAAKAAEQLSYELGIGVVQQPLRKPPAPQVEVVAGSHPEATYWLAVTLTGQNGEESAAGESCRVSGGSGHGLRVSCPLPEPWVSGWSLYAGSGPGELMLQVPTPLPVSVAWELPVEGIQAGRSPGEGQTAEVMIEPRRRLRRG